MQMRSEAPAFILGIGVSHQRIEDLLVHLAEHGVPVDALNSIKEEKFDFFQFIKKNGASTAEAWYNHLNHSFISNKGATS